MGKLINKNNQSALPTTSPGPHSGWTDNYELYPYRFLEPYTGACFQYDWLSPPQIWYDPASWKPQDRYWYFPAENSNLNNAIMVLDYQYANSTYKNKLIPTEKFLTNKSMHYVYILDPGIKPSPWGHAFPKTYDINEYYISFKYKAWLGWNTAYTSSADYYNPVFGASSLSDVKKSLDGGTLHSPLYKADSFSFGYWYFRYSSTIIDAVQSQYFWAFGASEVYNGAKQLRTAQKTSTSCDGYNSSNVAADFKIQVPGAWNDITDSDHWCIYGYLASAYKLNNGSYITLENYYHSQHAPLTYIGDDANYISGQTWNSASGFLSLSSSSQDNKDKLRHIYKFTVLPTKNGYPRSFGNPSAALEYGLQMLGVVNQRQLAKLRIQFSCTPIKSTGTQQYSITVTVYWGVNKYADTNTSHVVYEKSEADTWTFTMKDPYGYSNSKVFSKSSIYVDAYCKVYVNYIKIDIKRNGVMYWGTGGQINIGQFRQYSTNGEPEKPFNMAIEGGNGAPPYWNTQPGFY